MPEAKIGGIRLHYEIHGHETAEPLLLISGLGYSARLWFLQVPELAKHFKLITFDNRDVGKSERLDKPYTITQMAADASGLLDHLGIETAFVVGASMGGYIAQELAIDQPERVRKLVLLCTHYGGAESMQLTRHLWNEILDVAGLSIPEIYRQGLKYATTPQFLEHNPELAEELVRMRLVDPQPASAFHRQITAAQQFSAKERVHSIQAPTLVVAGREDRLVPLKLVEQLTGAIPGARLEVIENAGHLLFVEYSEEVNHIIIQFLQE